MVLRVRFDRKPFRTRSRSVPSRSETEERESLLLLESISDERHAKIDGPQGKLAFLFLAGEEDDGDRKTGEYCHSILPGFLRFQSAPRKGDSGCSFRDAYSCIYGMHCLSAILYDRVEWLGTKRTFQQVGERSRSAEHSSYQVAESKRCDACSMLQFSVSSLPSCRQGVVIFLPGSSTVDFGRFSRKNRLSTRCTLGKDRLWSVWRPSRLPSGSENTKSSLNGERDGR